MPLNSELGAWATRFALPPGESAAFTWTAEQSKPYPAGVWSKPLAPPKRAEKPRKLVACELVLDTWTNPADPTPIGLLLVDSAGTCYTDLKPLADAGMLAHSALNRTTLQGAFLCFWNGAALAFHSFLRHIAPQLLPLGYQVAPMSSSSDIHGIRLSLGKQTWMLTDVGTMTGFGRGELGDFLRLFGDYQSGGRLEVERVYTALQDLQRFTLGNLGVSLRASVGSLAIRAASYHLPTEPRWWRPPPLLVAACREGGAYRGGYVYGERYSGPAWRIDVNKLYSWAMLRPVPSAYAFGRCRENGAERPGIFLCRVKGQSNMPVYLPIWSGHPLSFRKRTGRGADGLCWLPQDEFAGVRAMGYEVQPLVGWTAVEHVDLAPFVRVLLALESTAPRGTAQHQLCKLLANSLYGKLAERPDRTDLAYSIQVPEGDWWPYTDATGQIVPDLWCRPTTVHRPYHHIDAGAVITARGRAHLYRTIADWVYRGGRIVHADTDGLVLTSDPQGAIALQSDEPGGWRLDAIGADCTVIRAKCYRLGAEVYTAGVSGVLPEQIQIAADSGQVTFERRVLQAPWESVRTFTQGIYTLRQGG